jgi:acetyl-CoA acetyltransferase
MTREAYIYEAVRTPFGRYGGALAGVRPDDLAAHALRALLERVDGLDPARIDDVILGNANGAGEENRDVARMAALLAGLPTSVPGATVNRLCGSSLEASIQATRAIAGVDPGVFGIAPVKAADKALARAGLSWNDIAAVELNEALHRSPSASASARGWPSSSKAESRANTE